MSKPTRAVRIIYSSGAESSGTLTEPLATRTACDFFIQIGQLRGILGRFPEAGTLISSGEFFHLFSDRGVVNRNHKLSGGLHRRFPPAVPGHQASHPLIPDGCRQLWRLPGMRGQSKLADRPPQAGGISSQQKQDDHKNSFYPPP